jgi:hypothetical protein
MPQIKIIHTEVQTEDEVVDTLYGDTVSLDGALTFSAQCAVDVDTPSAKTFDSGVAASLVDQSITYTANERGVAGDDITLELIDPGTDSALIIDVTDLAIVVTLAYATGAVTTDADALVAALNLDPDASALITASGTGNTPLTALAETPLAGGVASEVSISVAEVTELTFDTKANTDEGDYVVLYDTLGRAWAAAADLTGSDPEPTGEVWASIPSARKAQVDLSAATTAADVAAAFEVALDALGSFPFTTDDSAADGTMVVTCTTAGHTLDAETFNTDDSGAGSIAAAVTEDGANGLMTIPTHGLTTGLKGQLTSTGTLPGGLSTATDYFVIVVDANTISLASTLANAIAEIPVPVVLTNQGSSGAVNTFTPTSIAGASVKLQKSNDGATWSDEGSATNITVDANIWLEKVNPTGRYMRLAFAITAGRFSASNTIVVKGPN